MTTAVDDGLLARNPVRIKGASAERMIERPLLRWDDVRALAGAIHPKFECLGAASGAQLSGWCLFLSGQSCKSARAFPSTLARRCASTGLSDRWCN